MAELAMQRGNLGPEGRWSAWFGVFVRCQMRVCI